MNEGTLELLGLLIERDRELLDSCGFLEGFNIDDEFACINRHNKDIRDILGVFFENLVIPKRLYDTLIKILSCLQTRAIPQQSPTGIVITGFGREGIFPLINTISIYGVFEN